MEYTNKPPVTSIAIRAVEKLILKFHNRGTEITVPFNIFSVEAEMLYTFQPSNKNKY